MNQSAGLREAIQVSVDVVLLTLVEQQLHAVLLRRAVAPFSGVWALPGGFVHTAEDADAQASAARVLKSKVGIEGAYLEQLATFSGPARDPRGWSVAVAYCALLPVQNLPPDRADLLVVPVSALPQLPFDHRAILDAALARVRSKSLYSSLPVHLCGETFTLPQLQQVYENILGEPLNKVSFRRKMDEMDWLEPVPGAMQQGGAHRPAQLYRAKPGYSQTLALSARGL
ncbi:NUDIX hydrolase [Comamonas sp. Y33R10-2]|uniref:NUDIX hydrolase n=1 Tax=Comamonas sp. Y33R10-2 TaxID=2853257 RepID=UPI001C5CB388|nr:NUDIX domain-containing protein [Comamonas sp. Y33R10-2]QXZ09848.1 NUDIX hydrolase [Comamonas sp. Y33R10-2]